MRKQLLEATPMILVTESRGTKDIISVSRETFREAEKKVLYLYTYVFYCAVLFLGTTVIGELYPEIELSPWIAVAGVVALALAVHGWLHSKARAARLILHVIRKIDEGRHGRS